MVPTPTQHFREMDMPVRIIEIDDTLPDRVEYAIARVNDSLRDWVAETHGVLPCVFNPAWKSLVNEIVYDSIPNKKQELENIWYLHKSELIKAYQNAGHDIPNQTRIYVLETVAIHCYIDQQIREWFRDNAQRIANEFRIP